MNNKNKFINIKMLSTLLIYLMNSHYIIQSDYFGNIDKICFDNDNNMYWSGYYKIPGNTTLVDYVGLHVLNLKSSEQNISTIRFNEQNDNYLKFNAFTVNPITKDIYLLSLIHI